MACALPGGGYQRYPPVVRITDYVAPVPSCAKQTGLIAADGRTDNAGRFEIEGLQPGAYRIEVSDDVSRHAVLIGCLLDEGKAGACCRLMSRYS